MKIRRGLIKFCILLLAINLPVTNVMAKSCLWQVTSGKSTLYLQGSIHVLRENSYPLDPAIETAYVASDVLVQEVDMQTMSSAETQARILREATLPKGQTLRTTLDQTTYKLFNQACLDTNIPATIMEPLKPWYAAMSLSMIKLQSMGFNPNYGLDKYFNDKATADKKKIIGLETIDFQIKLFSSLSEEDPNKMINRTLTELKIFKEDIEKMEQAWKKGDIETLGALLTKSFDDYPDTYKRFILDRNAAWVKILDTLLEKSETHMVVVGAGHLSGQGGLIELLKNNGYALKQL